MLVTQAGLGFERDFSMLGVSARCPDQSVSEASRQAYVADAMAKAVSSSVAARGAVRPVAKGYDVGYLPSKRTVGSSDR